MTETPSLELLQRLRGVRSEPATGGAWSLTDEALCCLAATEIGDAIPEIVARELDMTRGVNARLPFHLLATALRLKGERDMALRGNYTAPTKSEVLT